MCITNTHTAGSGLLLSLMDTDNTSDEELLFHKLNQETGKINWSELQRHFARGVVVIVDKELDLVKTARQISLDQDNAIQSLIDHSKIYRATDDDAIRWNENQQTFWAVVIAPWVLVQEI